MMRAVFASAPTHLIPSLLSLVIGATTMSMPSLADHCVVGVIVTVAGDGWIDEHGQGRCSGDGGAGTQASLYWPRGLALGPDGSLYIADARNHRIRKVDPAGIITTVAGTGRRGYSGDGAPAITAQLDDPWGVAVGRDGSLYIADTWNHRIRKVDPAGIITTVAGGGSPPDGLGDGGPASAASLSVPTSVVADADGTLYIADGLNQRVRKVDAGGIITTVAGDGWKDKHGFGGRYAGDGGPARAASLRFPTGLAVTADGSLYIADHGNHRIRKVDPAGIITTVAGGGNPPDGLGDGGRATAASLSWPRGVAIGSGGSIYIADEGNHRIRKVDVAGIITTIAGDGNAGYWGDGGVATEASLHFPFSVAVTADAEFYIADRDSHRVRKVRWRSCDPEVARETADELRAEAGKSTDTWREVVELYLIAEAWDDALAAAEHLVAITPEADQPARMRAEVLVARVYAAKRDDHEARRRLMRVLARAKDPVALREAADLLVNIYLRREERDQAIATLDDLRLRTQDRGLIEWIDQRLKEIAGE